MAIGDCFSVFLGTAESNRQPSSGVFEVVRSITKPETTDAFVVYDGSNAVDIYAAAARTSIGEDTALNTHVTNTLNLSHLIGNSVYVRKEGTTRRVGLSGVQVDT
jgi:hypothetical protein